MSAKLYMADSGGTARLIKKLYMADSGGTARLIKKLYMADSGGTAHLVYASQITGTIVAGVDGDNTGYGQGGYGSLSGYSGPAGISLDALYDFLVASPPSYGAVVVLGGFSSNPGSSYITSITANSNTFLGSSASYSYASGAGTWQWGSETFGFVNGDSYPFTIDIS